MNWLPIAWDDVMAFAAGRGADGLSPLQRQVSFPRNQDRQTAVALLASTMCLFIDVSRPGLLNDPARRTAIVFKLVAHLSRTGNVDPARIREAIQDAAMAAMSATVMLLCQEGESPAHGRSQPM